MQNTTAASALATKPPFSDPEQNLQCPRCESTNTKFCYFNNYNLSQPRHFCKDCRRYWTRGGALRNIPVGGGTRKSSKRPSSMPSAARKNSANSAASVPLVDEDHRMLDISGSFSSLLSSTSLFGNILEGDAAMQAVEDSFLGLPVETIGWGGGWPDLTIYTPDTRFE